MSDLKIAEFRERAERGLAIPDLATIERQGRALRRRRLAAVAGGLALAVGAGLGITSTVADSSDGSAEPATSPSNPPIAPSDPGVRTTFNRGEEVLLPGRSEVAYGEFTTSFDVPGEGWEWWGGGMGLRRAPDDLDHYGAAVIFLPEARARLQPCSYQQAQDLGTDPDDLLANVEPLLDLAMSTVLQEPRVVSAFGTEAVHVRLLTSGTCGDGPVSPAQLGGMVDGVEIGPGWGGRRVLDLWHVVAPGPAPTSLLVASWDLARTEAHHDQQQALLDSLRIDVG